MQTQASKTYNTKPADVQKRWIVVDAENLVVGRAASIIAMRLRGKHLPTFTPNVDDGDNVIVVNAEKVAFTGRKRQQQTYYRHTGYPGGLKSVTADKVLDGRFPERVLLKAVERMMPKDSPLARRQMKNLHIYAGPDHPHEAQQPEALDIAAMNAKNTRSA